jgi:2,3,4,5-tetrahydropyridine-2,6-dicarboxylate N-succinyltransferase
MQNEIERLFNAGAVEYTDADYSLFEAFREALNRGVIRAAEPIDGEWTVNPWVKQGILLGFRMGRIVAMPGGGVRQYTDKHTYPERVFEPDQRIRLVPGGSSVREGAYIGPQVTMMPPMYVNVGAYVDEGTMIDSHALVGSCAQVGKRVHLSAGAILGGVLEPVGANPVIVEDDVFIGGNTGLYEGVIVKRGAIVAAGVIITAGTPVYDAVKGEFLPCATGKAPVIPEYAVIVSGSRELRNHAGFHLYCPILIKYRDAKSDRSVTLETLLR